MIRWFILTAVLPALAALLKHQDDGDLVDRLKRRDPQALSELYDRYGRLTYSVILRVVHNEGVAEDLVQETFLRIWNRAAAFDQTRGALGPWILTVARNRAIDYLRSVEGRASESIFQIDKLEHPALFCDLESGILNLDRVRVVQAAMSKLNANQRMVIELAYFEGLSQTEMSERLKQPLGTVKSWVRGALKTLRDEIGEAVVVA